MNGKLLHEETTRLIIGAGMDVHNSVGPGWDEWDYHRAMMKALADRGLKAESHLRGSLMHRGECVDRFELDIIVENKVILELKHLRTDFAPEHYTQLIGYLKFWRKDLGLLLNFGGDRLRFKRVPYSPAQWELEMAGKFDELLQDHQGQMTAIRSACLNVLDEHGLGYRKNTCEKLLKCEVAYQGLAVRKAVANLRYGNLVLGERESECFLVDSDFVVRTSVMHDNTNSVDLVRLQSCMKQLNIKNGLLVNFGKKLLLLRGVCI